ncbi:MAG TPA: SRPBCC domain-containing protein [Chloroflexota bacterium]|nr:SRPBCC domain-containing protein [Chloroflexota bacterium]
MTVSEINAVVSETRIAATPQTVFAFFVDPTKMVRWMGARAVVDARPGGTYALDINAQARARGEFVEVVPYSRVVFTFGWEDDQAVPPGSSTVEVTLTPDGEGTHVRLVHRGLMTTEMREQHSHGWQLYLGRLGIAAGGGDPGPDPNTRSTSEGG